ncbi:MAG: ChbG/HpnK family deacetylase, partial [Chloroflexi bacterium]|nr:ChbG/HpnK family deacetylase [Chloroflexota bacterium]
MTRFLVVNADDFGRSRGVSAGIVEAHLHGLVSTTTALMNLPGTALDVAQAVREVPSLGLGVHLNLTLGRPVSAPATVSTLISADGVFWPPDALAARGDGVNPEQVRREWRAQVE